MTQPTKATTTKATARPVKAPPKPVLAPVGLTTLVTKTKETKGTFLFGEVPTDEHPLVFRTQYVTKEALAVLAELAGVPVGSINALRVTVEIEHV